MFDPKLFGLNMAHRRPRNVSTFLHEFAFSSTLTAAQAFMRIVRATLFLVVASGVAATAQTLTGHTPRQVLDGRATRVSHYNGDQKLRLAMSIKAPNMAGEEQLIRQQQTKGSPNFHQFLTSEQWDAQFAPSVDDEQKVVDWAVSQGLTVTHRYSHRLIVDIEGTVDTIEKAFGVTINNYQLRDEVDFSNDRDPIIPANLANIVTSVQGLNNIQREHGSAPGSENLKGPDYSPGPVVGPGSTLQKDGDPTKLPGQSNLNGNALSNLSGSPAPIASANGNSVPSLNANGFMDPVNLYSSEAYNYNGLQALSHCCNVHNDSGGSPAVSSIAIVGWGNFLNSDIQGFQSTYPYLAVNFTWYNIDGTASCLPTPPAQQNPPCATGETTEDIEWTIATSNSFGSANSTSHVYAYLGGNFNLSTYTDLYSQVLDDNLTRVMTTSWSCTENYDCGYDGTTNSVIGARHAIFNKMVGMGWTLIAASGDRGAADDCQNNVPKKPAPQLDPTAHTSVAYPASDLDFLAAGGTQIRMNSNGTWQSEQAWQGGFNTGSCNGNGGGSGGGVSVYFNQPSWQSPLSKLGSNRLTPDVSLNALGQGQNLYINGGLNGDANGTSVVAPELAGFFAQENTYLNYIGNICGNGTQACTPVGVPTPYIYNAAIDGAPHDPFYNMLSGCNSNDATQQDGLRYFCAGAHPPSGIPGSLNIANQDTQYNLVSGWGSANLMQLAWAINFQLIPAYGSPSIKFSGPATNKWYNSNQTVSWTLSDSGSSGYPAPGPAGFTQGWDSIPADPYSEPNGGTGNSFYSGPQFPFATYGCLAFEPNGCSGGSGQGCHTVKVEGWDNQGVTANGSYGPLCYDSVAPTVTISNSPSTPNSGWYNQPVKVTLNATDPGGSNASGILRSYYAINYAGCVPGSINYCSFYTGPFTISAQGQYTIYYFTEDNAGNYNSSNTEVVKIDLSTPVTKATLSGTVYSGSTYESAVKVTLSATDSGGSGIAGTFYTLDGSPLIPYFAPINVSTVGSHTVQYWSLNTADTTEAKNTVSFSIESPTTVSLSASPNPSVNGQSVTLTATVTASVSGNTPTGSVTFFNGSTKLGSGNLSGGVATLTTSTLAVGTDSLSASYAGATNFINSSSSAVAEVVHEKTTTTLSSTSNTAVYGSSVTITATVTPSISGTPTGSVQFLLGTASLGIVTLKGGSASLSTTTLAVGHDSITAVYSGDSTYATSTSSALSETITAAATTTKIASSLNPSAYKESVTFTATVTSTAGTPTGTVTFLQGTTTLGSETLNGSGQATFATTALAVGTDPITVSYGGATDYSSSTSSALSQVVKTAATTTTLSSSLNPSAYKQSVTFTATVTSTAGTPTGTVTFLQGTATLGSGTLNSSGQATFATTALPLGTDPITASYGGATDFSSSSSSALSQVVKTAATTTTLGSSLNPSAYKQSVTFTATVTSAAGTPTGTVTFSEGSTTLGSGTVNGSGQATFTTTALAVGTDSITASYGGATDFGTSSSTLSQVVNTAATTTALASSLNPSAYGQSVTFTATVTSTAGTPTGTVVFKSGSTILGTGTLNGSGQATFATTAMAVGTHPITASYGGDAHFSAGNSAAVSQVINTAATTTKIASNLNPSAYGQSVTCTATVTSTAGTPTGTVTFSVNGKAQLPVTLNGSGQATFSTTQLPVGTVSITANYGGATDYSSSTSSTLSQVVKTAATTTTLGSSLNPSVYKQSVTFTATVTSTAGTPTGTVTFLEGTTTLGSGTLNSSGQATFATTALPLGTDPITASYGGATDYSSSTSSTLSQVVKTAATTTTLSTSLNPSVYEESVTFTAKVTSTAGIPTGIVTFLEGTTTLGSGILNGSGQATLATTALPLGTDPITASYGGATDFSTSTSAALSQVVKTLPR